MNWILLIALAWLALFSGEAYANPLPPDSTMDAWNGASPDDRDATLEAIGPSLTPSFRMRKGELMACLNLAGQNAAHATLTIGEVAQACAEMVDPHQAPTQPDDV